MGNRINLQLKREDRIMSSWEISSFLKTLAGIYYKTDLINTFNETYNNPIYKENLFIMSESFNTSTLYSFLKDEPLSLDRPNNLYRWLHLGNPIPIGSSNANLFKINRLFSLYKSVNTKLREQNVKPIDKVNLYNLFENIEISMNDIKEEINSLCLPLIEENIDSEEISRIRRLKDDIDLIIDRHLNVERESFNRDTFFDKLNGLSRPVIGYYLSETNEIKILNPFNINKKYQKNTLDVRKIEHNSPTLFCFSLGIIGAAFLIPFSKLIYHELTQKETLNEAEQRMLEKVEKDIIKLEEKYEFETTESDVSEKLSGSSKELNSKLAKLLKDNKMINEYIDINIEDVV